MAAARSLSQGESSQTQGRDVAAEARPFVSFLLTSRVLATTLASNGGSTDHCKHGQRRDER